MRSYDTLNTNSLRLWSALPDLDLDLSKFNEGEYGTALAARQRALEITQVMLRMVLSGVGVAACWL